MSRIEILRDRGHMLAASRYFFSQRQVLEVDCPLLTAGASIDAHIDLIPAQNNAEIRYLHSSPEYGMKRLLTENIGDIYQLSHVFRAGEESHKHNPEFMMAEWYRLGITFEAMIHETCDYIRLFLGELHTNIVSYRDTILRHTGIDYVHATDQELLQCLTDHNITYYPSLADEGKDSILNIILGSIIEPLLGKNELYVLAYYPSTQAALAQTQQHEDETVAERFEVYYQGVELANGYHELANANEQRQRLIDSNTQRQALNKNTLPIDEHFLIALTQGLPDCCGVAVGFDRLMMLRHHSHHIKDVTPFYWHTA